MGYDVFINGEVSFKPTEEFRGRLAELVLEGGEDNQDVLDGTALDLMLILLDGTDFGVESNTDGLLIFPPDDSTRSDEEADNVLELIAPYVSERQVLNFEGEDGARWRYVFEPGQQMRREYANTRPRWPDDPMETALRKFVAAVEADAYTPLSKAIVDAYESALAALGIVKQ